MHGLSSWLRTQQRLTQQRFWQIVQLIEETPGVFRVWAFTDDRTLRSVRVKVNCHAAAYDQAIGC